MVTYFFVLYRIKRFIINFRKFSQLFLKTLLTCHFDTVVSKNCG